MSGQRNKIKNLGKVATAMKLIHGTLSIICVIIAVTSYILINMSNTLSSITTKSLNETYDFIIVGGGTAGSVLASRLTEDSNVTVLLLEAGGDYTENPLYHIPSTFGLLQHTAADWAYYTEPQEQACKGLKENKSFWPSGRVLGGSSVLNVMVYTRGLAKDYDKWAENGCDGWNYKEVFPYFLKSEDILIDELKDSKFHGKGGPLAVSDGRVTTLQDYYMRAAKDAGFQEKDYNEMEGEGIGKAQLTIRKGTRSSTGLEYLGPAKDRQNLHVAVNSFVTKVKIENKRAVGVYVIRDNKKRLITSRKEVIISAGAISTPTILMHSGIGPSTDLEKLKIAPEADLPVGENLHNNFALFFNVRINQSLSSNPNKISSLKSKMEYHLFQTGYLSVPSVEAYLLACSQNTGSRDCTPNLQFMFISMPLLFNIMEAREDIFHQYLEKGKNEDGFFVVIGILNPRSKGKVYLRSDDPFDYPKIQPNFLTSQEDVETILSGIRIAEKLIETDVMKSIGASVDDMRLEICGAHKFRSDEYWRCVIRHVGTGLSHYTGTCKMGSNSDPTVVVDPKLRVKGIEGLRVVDASVMPDLISGSTYAPVVMIAEKAADIIRE